MQSNEWDAKVAAAREAGFDGKEIPAEIAVDHNLRHEYEQGQKQKSMMMSDRCDAQDF
jgi:hypothetical protein